MKKIIAGALLLTMGTATAFACCGGHGSHHYSNRNINTGYYHYCVDANHDGVCDNYTYHHSGAYRNYCHW